MDGQEYKPIAKSIFRGKEISSITGQANPLAQQANDILNSNNGKLAKILGRSSHTFDPRIPLLFLPEKSGLNYTEMTAILTRATNRAHQSIKGVTTFCAARFVDCSQRLSTNSNLKRKMQENVHDFDDIQRLAADLLLARCPEKWFVTTTRWM